MISNFNRWEIFTPEMLKCWRAFHAAIERSRRLRAGASPREAPVFFSNWEDLMSLLLSSPPRRKPRNDWRSVFDGRITGFPDRFATAYARSRSSGGKEWARFRAKVPDLAISRANLFAAAHHIQRCGGPAPGPDGVVLQEFEEFELWHLVGELHDRLASDEYQPGPIRQVRIPKASGGKRKLSLLSADDRVVQRALAQILGPILDPQFDASSFAFRPGRGRQEALATAERLARSLDCRVWIVEDIQKAFDRVPVKRLLPILNKRIHYDELASLVETAVRGARPGLLQGAPLSPLLLNVYLDHLLDRPWRRRQRTTPLIRWADDLLILCHDEDEARHAYSALDELLRPTGMQLKGSADESIHNLRESGRVEWLGFSIGWQNDQLDVRIARSMWQALRTRLIDLHSKPDTQRRGRALIQGWLAQQGPTLEEGSFATTANRVTRLLADCGFTGIIDRKEIRRRLRAARNRWRSVRQDSL